MKTAVAGNDWTMWLVAGVLAVAYAVFAHYASAIAHVGPWAILFACAPMFVTGFGFIRESRLGAFVFVLALCGLGLLAWLWPTLANPISWLYFLQSVGVTLAMAAIFGRTLVAGRRPLCTVFASVIHEEMTPLLLRYTRQITVAWTVFFLSDAAISALLFFFAPIEFWSMYANILALPLVGLMFLVENEVRKHVLPVRDQVGLRATVRAFRATFKP